MRLLIPIFMFLSPAAFADFNGVWEGPGIGKNGNEGESPDFLSCGLIQIELKHSKKQLDISQSSYRCDSPNVYISISGLEERFEISGKNLMFEGVKAGTISKYSIDIDYYNAVTSSHRKYSFKLSDGVVKYNEQYRNDLQDYVQWELSADLKLTKY